jgi:hypothetical protein
VAAPCVQRGLRLPESRRRRGRSATGSAWLGGRPARVSAKPPSVENERVVDRVRAGGFCALANLLSPRAPSSPNSISASERDTKRALRSWPPCLPSGELVSRCGLFEDRLSSRYCVRILEDKLIYRRR